MILTRLGNKSRIAAKIWPLFPSHTTYIEPFFGAGGMFFSKPKAPYNFVSDIDNDVFNLFQVVMHRKSEFVDVFSQMPIHEGLLQHWKKNRETDPILQACRFILLSNFTLLGKQGTLIMEGGNPRQLVLSRLDATQNALSGVRFSNRSYEKFLGQVRFRSESDRASAFVYCDPPYLSTGHRYSDGFTESDTRNLFAVLMQSGLRFAVSEFAHPVVLEMAESHGLNVIHIGERQSLKKRDTEILVTNYKTNSLF
jgi:DNA adenine methylase